MKDHVYKRVLRKQERETLILLGIL
jgi:hypothetical protein